MSGFLRGIVRLAIGTGPTLEPLMRSGYEGGLGFEEHHDETSAPAAQTRALETRTERTERLLQPIQPIHSQTDIHTHEQGEVTYIREGDQINVIVEPAEPHAERTLRETRNTLESRETKETIRDLLREANLVRTETTLTEVETLQREFTNTHTKETLRETERLIREIETAAPVPKTRAERRQDALRQKEIVPVEPLVEINIGRIEVRAAAPQTKEKREKAVKPKGVIELNDYLRERSKGSM